MFLKKDVNQLMNYNKDYYQKIVLEINFRTHFFHEHFGFSSE